MIPAYDEAWAESGLRGALERALGEHLRRRAPDDHRPGDVLLFRMPGERGGQHLGILTPVPAGDAFVHAYTRHGVVESYLTPPWHRRVKACFAFPSA